MHSKAYLSTRTGTWVTRRIGLNGRPFDIQFLRRSWNTMFHLTPYPILCSSAEWYINTRFDHEVYGLKPNHRIFSQHVMVNDELPNRIMSGTVIVKGNIERFTENGVIFEGIVLRKFFNYCFTNKFSALIAKINLFFFYRFLFVFFILNFTSNLTYYLTNNYIPLKISFHLVIYHKPIIYSSLLLMIH